MKISELIKQLEEVKEFVGDKQVYLERRYNEPFMVYSRLKIEAHTLKVVPVSDTYLILRTNKDCCMDLSSWDVDDNLEKRKSKSCF